MGNAHPKETTVLGENYEPCRIRTPPELLPANPAPNYYVPHVLPGFPPPPAGHIDNTTNNVSVHDTVIIDQDHVVPLNGVQVNLRNSVGILTLIDGTDGVVRFDNDQFYVIPMSFLRKFIIDS